MTVSQIDPLTNWKGFYEELQNESERGAVIIAGAFLDAQLKDLITKFFIDEPKTVEGLLDTDRPLSSFSSRIKVAYCLGLISKSMYDDLNAIRKIRNNFAHQMHGYTFDDPQIVSWCKSLKLAKMITDEISHFPNTHRTMFLLGVTQLASQLALKALAAERNRRTVAKDPEIAQVVKVGSESK